MDTRRVQLVGVQRSNGIIVDMNILPDKVDKRPAQQLAAELASQVRTLQEPRRSELVVMDFLLMLLGIKLRSLCWIFFGDACAQNHVTSHCKNSTHRGHASVHEKVILGQSHTLACRNA